MAKKLKNLISDVGISICNDPLRCKGYLMDYCSDNRKEVNVLIIALEQGIPVELSFPHNVSLTLIQGRLVERLYSEYGLDKELAAWAVEAWAYALDLSTGMQGSIGNNKKGRTLELDEVLNNEGSNETLSGLPLDSEIINQDTTGLESLFDDIYFEDAEFDKIMEEHGKHYNIVDGGFNNNFDNKLSEKIPGASQIVSTDYSDSPLYKKSISLLPKPNVIDLTQNKEKGQIEK